MTAPLPLQGKVVCVTGAGRGLGAAIARAFSAEGASLVLGARTLEEIDAVARELGDAIAVQADVRSPDEVYRLVDAAVAEYGQLDVMVNNAGVAIYGHFEDVTEMAFDLMIDTNLKGAFFGSQAAYRVMKAQRHGLIINISSIAGQQHLPGEAAYNASKWALNGFSGTLRLEAQKHNVKVTTVCPGGIDTPFWKAMDWFPFPVDLVDPERDFLDPAEVARQVVAIAMLSDRCTIPEVVLVPMLPQLSR